MKPVTPSGDIDCTTAPCRSTMSYDNCWNLTEASYFPSPRGRISTSRTRTAGEAACSPVDSASANCLIQRPHVLHPSPECSSRIPAAGCSKRWAHVSTYQSAKASAPASEFSFATAGIFGSPGSSASPPDASDEDPRPADGDASWLAEDDAPEGAVDSDRAGEEPPSVPLSTGDEAPSGLLDSSASAAHALTDSAPTNVSADSLIHDRTDTLTRLVIHDRPRHGHHGTDPNPSVEVLHRLR